MLNTILDFIKGARGSSQTRLVVLVTAALTVIGVTIFAAQPWGGSDKAQAEDPPRICDFFPDYFLCEPTVTLTPSNTPTITNTPTQTLTPTNTLTPTETPTFIPKLTSTAPPKAIIGGGTGGAAISGPSRYVPMFNTGLYVQPDDANQPMPSDGTVTHFFVRLDEPPAVADYTFIIVDGSYTGGPVRCTVGATETTCSNRSSCWEFSAGDLISVLASGNQPVGSAATMSWTAVFTPNATCPSG